MKFKSFAITLIITLLLAGCGTSKKVVHSNNSGTISVVNNVSEIIKLEEKNQLNFKTANASGISLEVNIKNLQKTVNASCKIVTDSAIYFSVIPVFGIEMFRLELTPEKFILVDKLNKNYYSESYNFFKKEWGLSISFYDIQSLISNRLFTMGKEKVQTSDFMLKEKNNASAILVHNNDTIIQASTISLSQNRIIQTILEAIKYNYELNAGYSNFTNFEGYKFPKKIAFSVKKNGTIGGAVNFNIENVEFNVPITLKPINLSKYDKGDIRNFLKK